MTDKLDYWIMPAVGSDSHMSVIDDIITHIERVTKIPIATKGRYRILCEGRQLAAYIMYTRLGISLNSIGERLNIDHSTVSHAIKCVKNLLMYDKRFVSRWKNIIDYADLAKDINVIKAEAEQSESELPVCCGQCKAYIPREHLCSLRFIKAYDRKPIAKECRTYHLTKREL